MCRSFTIRKLTVDVLDVIDQISLFLKNVLSAIKCFRILPAFRSEPSSCQFSECQSLSRVGVESVKIPFVATIVGEEPYLLQSYNPDRLS